MIQRRTILNGADLLAAGLAIPGLARAAGRPLRVAIVAKSLGNGFFNAVHLGGEEAAKSLGGIEVIFTGLTDTAAEHQIDVINSLVAQHVDAIAISANDPDALVPVCRRAMQRGIRVISYDSGIAPEGRLLDLADATSTQVGVTLNQLAADACGGKGRIAVVSATATSTNQNQWIAAMRADMPNHSGLELVSVVYGDDLADKSYRETQALLQKFSDLAVIVSPSSVGIVAAARAVDDVGRSGKPFVTGLGLPGECIGAVTKGTIKSFAIWNPVDIGFAVVSICAALVKGGDKRQIDAGRLGRIGFDADGRGTLGKPTIYDRSSVQAAAKLF